MTIRVVALAGSHRKNGNTEIGLSKIAEKLSFFSVETEIIPLADKKINNCKACDSCRKMKRCIIQDDLQEILEKMIAAQGIILAAPVYNFALTPLMSSFLVRTTRITHVMSGPVVGEEKYIVTYPHRSILRGKVGAAFTIARRSGSNIALASLNNFFLSNEMYLVGSCYENVVFGYSQKDILNDHEGIRNLNYLAENMGILLNKLFSGY